MRVSSKVELSRERMNVEDDGENNNMNCSSSSSSSSFPQQQQILYRDKTSRVVRQLLHPLELHDTFAFQSIKTVRLDFLSGEEVTSPIPRCQDLPTHAFSRLTGRSILVSVSHAWFFQTHPDPYGAKLDLLKNVFAPLLKARYPHTDIQVFFDFLSLPQEPRTDDDNEKWCDAVNRMASVYIYSDVILLLDTDLPEIDMTIHTAKISMSTYEFCDFIDTVQVLTTSSKNGPQNFDSILSVGNVKVVKSCTFYLSLSLSLTHTHTHTQ